MRKQPIPGAGPLELAGAGFVFGIAAGVVFGLLNTNAIWPIACAGVAGIVVGAMARAWPILRGLQPVKRALTQEASRKA